MIGTFDGRFALCVDLAPCAQGHQTVGANIAQREDVSVRGARDHKWLAEHDPADLLPGLHLS
jgi:hypothetical protein